MCHILGCRCRMWPTTGRGPLVNAHNYYCCNVLSRRQCRKMVYRIANALSCHSFRISHQALQFSVYRWPVMPIPHWWQPQLPNAFQMQRHAPYLSMAAGVEWVSENWAAAVVAGRDKCAMRAVAEWMPDQDQCSHGLHSLLQKYEPIVYTKLVIDENQREKLPAIGTCGSSTTGADSWSTDSNAIWSDFSSLSSASSGKSILAISTDSSAMLTLSYWKNFEFYVVL